MTRRIGDLAEEAVANYLSQQRYEILARNVVYPFGELDLVAKDKKTVVFIEVKYRKTLAYGSPLEAVSRAKQKKVILAAKAYLQQYRQLPECRFDVVSLWGDVKNPHIEHCKDAFCDEEFS